MDPSVVADIGQQTLLAVLAVAGPILGVALAVGLFIGIFQAATSINEMTLSFIPKLLAMLLTLAVAGQYMIVTLMDFTRAIFARIPPLFM